MQSKLQNENNTYSFAGRVLIVAAIVASVILLILLFGFVFKVLLFVLAGILMACFFRGVAGWFCGYTNLSMRWTLPLTLFAVFGIIILVNWLLAPQVASQANELSQQLPSAIKNARHYLHEQWWGRQIVSRLPDNPRQFMVNHAGWAMQTFGLLSSTFGVLSDIYIIGLIGLFIMFNPAPYVNGLVSLIPASSQKRACEVIREVYTILQRWLTGKLLSMLVVAVLTAIGLYIAGMPLILFLSLLAGLLSFIPNFGPIISLIPAALVAMIQGPSMVLYVIIIYIAVQVVESNFITPFIQRKMVFLPLAMIIIAQVVLGILVGGLGLILATPIVAMLMVLVKMLYIEDVLGQQVI